MSAELDAFNAWMSANDDEPETGGDYRRARHAFNAGWRAGRVNMELDVGVEADRTRRARQSLLQAQADDEAGALGYSIGRNACKQPKSISLGAVAQAAAGWPKGNDQCGDPYPTEGETMLYVYHGYVSPDSHDASEGAVYRLDSCGNEADVMRLLREHNEATEDNPEVSNVIFTVIDGKKRRIEAVETVTKYELR